jgi:hypothetical protein
MGYKYRPPPPMWTILVSVLLVNSEPKIIWKHFQKKRVCVSTDKMKYCVLICKKVVRKNKKE